MEHDESVAVFESVPEVARVEVARLKPTDVIVVNCDALITREVVARITAHFKSIWPANEIIVLDRGLTMKIVAGEG